MILKYLRPREWGLIAVAICLTCIMVWLELEIPGYMSSITLIITSGGTVDEVISEGIGMIECALGSMAVSIGVGFIAAYTAASLAKRLRQMEFDNIERFSSADVGKFSTASLITRSTNDLTQIQMTMAMGLQVLIRAPIMAVWAIAKIIDKSWQWTMATAVSVVVIITVIGVIMAYVVPKFKKVQWLTDDVNRVTRENLSGVRVVRAYNAEKYQEDKFEKANDNLTGVNISSNRALAVMMPTIMCVMSCLTMVIYWIGAYLIDAASGTAEQFVLFSDMVVFSSYAMMVVMSFILLVVIFMMVPRAMVASKRVQEVINTEPSIKDGSLTESPEGSPKGEIEFRNVGFKYDGAKDYILKDISLKAEKGEVVAVIGTTGCGKSTLVGLIPRLHDVTEGQVLVDGVDVRDYTQEALHRKIGFVPQTAVMFTGTVSSNVRYGDAADRCTEDDVKRAVEIAQAKEFVEKMDGGYDAKVARGGTNVSGGQKQRLSIARAVCKKPEFYVFDDTFSALDYRTDRVLREALRKETSGVTTFIVAQRIGTIMDADRIIVLEDGRIVGMGTHRELLDSCPQYHDIASSQLSEEEMRK